MNFAFYFKSEDKIELIFKTFWDTFDILMELDNNLVKSIKIQQDKDKLTYNVSFNHNFPNPVKFEVWEKILNIIQTKIELIVDESMDISIKLILQKDNGLRHWTYAIINENNKIIL